MARILLVDDDHDFATALARLLAQEGYLTAVASHGAAALQVLDNQTADLIIADLQLYRESGLDLIEELQRRYPGLPVILLSASPDTASYLEALRIGAYEYLAKPLDFSELRQVLQRALSPAGRLT
ncbi:MAG: response regulator [Gemmataceae bacterium]|nr:response regulator [Gemmataceae bacterium]